MSLSPLCAFWAEFRAEARHLGKSAAVREVLIWCLPALAAGLILRGWLTAAMPWGYVQYDTAEYLATAQRFQSHHGFYLNGKRGFLVPILYTLPFLLRVPALVLIPLGQHLLGLAGVVLSGALVRAWFRRWRWFILPVTLWFAASPFALWYEQTLMGESEYLCACLALALAGTLWARRPSRARFAFLVGALLCTAGARPEGRAFFAFAFVLALLVLWREPRRLLRAVGLLALTGLIYAAAVPSSTAPQLLYASLLPLAPEHSRLLPGIEPYILPLRDEVRRDSGGDPLQLVKVSKRIRDDIDPYLWAHVTNGRQYYGVLNRTLRDLCLEALLAHPWQAATLPYQKFRLAVDGWSAYRFDAESLGRRQEQAYEANPWLYQELGRGLTGRALDAPGMDAFVESHYHAAAVAWLGRLEAAWQRAALAGRGPDRPAEHPRWVHDFVGGVPGGLATTPGLPWFYPLALLGMLAAMAGPQRRVHLAWAPVMLAVWAAATFVGVTNARYRFAYEPFCSIYLCLLLDTAATGAGALFRLISSTRGRRRRAAIPAAESAA